MQSTSTQDLVDQLRQATSDSARHQHAAALKLAIAGMQRSIDSLEVQLEDFYAAQMEHGRNLDDYKRMVISLDEQVRCYVEDLMEA